MKKNVIPPITHPMGSDWEQPPVSEVVIDDTHALMTLETFERLPEYSASRPSGVYEGKMWRRHNGAFDREFLARGGKPEWLLCWYGESDKPGYVSNNSRKIILVTGELPTLEKEQPCARTALP
jgi:hypothetical protein